MRLFKELGLAATLVASLAAPAFAGHLTPDEDKLAGAVLFDVVVKKICGPTMTEKQMADWKAASELVLKENNTTLEAVLDGKSKNGGSLIGFWLLDHPTTEQMWYAAKGGSSVAIKSICDTVKVALDSGALEVH
jgi:hypothetical protein